MNTKLSLAQNLKRRSFITRKHFLTTFKMVTSIYFSEIEFNRCVPSCSLQDMDPEAMARFDRVREYAGIPLVINSAYRTPAWDRSKGRSGTGAHTEGVALDFKCNTSENRYKIDDALSKEGCTRKGIAKTFIHADFSKTNPPRQLWTY
jgi:hypothetical protein